MNRTSSSIHASNQLHAATEISNNKPVLESGGSTSPTMHNRKASNAEWQTWQQLSKTQPMQSLIKINSAGQSVLHLAAEKNQCQFIDSLITHPKAEEFVLARDKGGLTPLMMAAELGQTDAVKSLLKHDSAEAQVTAVTAQGDNALMMAISAGHLDIVALLLKAGSAEAQISTVNKAGSSAISLALQMRHQSINALLKISSLL